jgi:hypothetical protein
MKFICLGYLDVDKWNRLDERRQREMMDACCAFDDELRAGGHFAGGHALQGADSGVTLSRAGGKVALTDGPFAEAREMLGGILVLEARDLNHAIQLMSRHPGVQMGPFEIRQAADLDGMVAESRKRRGLRE